MDEWSLVEHDNIQDDSIKNAECRFKSFLKRYFSNSSKEDFHMKSDAYENYFGPI